MNYKALKWIKKKHRVFRKYKNSSHPACRRVSKIVSREAKRAKYNFEKKLAENIKKDILCLCQTQGKGWKKDRTFVERIE